jgi:hypothetical protein
MSIHYSTTNLSKSKTLFSSPLPIRYGRIIWPKGMPYLAWQNLLKRCSIMNSKKRQKNSFSRCLRVFLKKNEHQRHEIMETRIEKIIHMPKCSEEPNNKDIKLELVTMLKHFLDRKHISQHIEKVIPVNSLKNRGNNLKHDYSRNPRSCFNWQGLSLLAFGIFELFRFSEAVTQRGDWPQRTLAHKLLSQLLQRPTMEIFSEKCLSTKIQFRYHFVVEKIKSNETPQKEVEEELKTG